MNELDEQDYSILQQDRKPLGARFHHAARNGRPLSADEFAKMQESADKRYASGAPQIATRFALPYYPESAGDYSFSAPRPCAGCGGEAIEFKSAVNDERHGHGTLTFDPATARVVKLEFALNAVPKPMTSGTCKVTYSYGRHDDGSWGSVRIEEHYAGHMLLISGTLDRTTTVSHVKHYASLDEAKRAFQAQ